jgi:hypothetical protein
MDKRLVLVKWTDAADPGNVGWHSDADVDEFTEESCEVVSVGWLKSETKKYVTLVADYIDNGDGTTTWGRPTKVPLGMVLSIEDLTIKPTDT